MTPSPKPVRCLCAECREPYPDGTTWAWSPRIDDSRTDVEAVRAHHEASPRCAGAYVLVMVDDMPGFEVRLDYVEISVGYAPGVN